jgi:glycopeptide antibiotics resistance protein
VSGVEAAQVFVISRVADTTDVVFGAAGLLAGAWLALGLQPVPQAADHRAADRRWPAVVAAAVWLAGVAASEWTPFDFSSDPGLVARHWAALFTLPFVNYFHASEWNAFINLVQKMLLVVPLGLLVAMGLGVDDTRSAARSASAVLLTGMLLGVIELGQVFLPTRYPDATDVILGTLGGGAAILLMAWLRPHPSRYETGTARSRYGTV